MVHTFPADGDYVFRMDLHGNADGFLFGGPTAGEQIEVSIDGERAALIDDRSAHGRSDDEPDAQDAGDSRHRRARIA